jgi:glycosyltransferase involved in cell wall biosynthesis
MKISLVIPAYNEAKRIEPFLRSLGHYVQRHRADIQEVLVIDDGSRDETAAIAERFKSLIPSLHVIRHQQNQGKGAAVRTGVLAAQGEAIVFMDADGATDSSELPNMQAALAQADVAIGNRWMPGAQTERHSLLRRLSGWTNRTYMRLFGLGTIDTMCGFKGYRREVAQKLFSDLQEKRWLFDTEVAYKAVRGGYRIINFPIRWQSKDGSKLSTLTLIKSGILIWPLIRRLKKLEKQRAVQYTS